MSFLGNAAFWAAVAALVASLGTEVSTPLYEHIVEAAAAILAIVGILTSGAQKGSGGG